MQLKKTAITALKVVFFGFTITTVGTAIKWQINKLTKEEVEKLYYKWLTEQDEDEKNKLENKALKAGYIFKNPPQEQQNIPLEPVYKMKLKERIKTEIFGK